MTIAEKVKQAAYIIERCDLFIKWARHQSDTNRKILNDNTKEKTFQDQLNKQVLLNKIESYENVISTLNQLTDKIYNNKDVTYYDIQKVDDCLPSEVTLLTFNTSDGKKVAREWRDLLFYLKLYIDSSDNSHEVSESKINKNISKPYRLAMKSHYKVTKRDKGIIIGVTVSPDDEEKFNADMEAFDRAIAEGKVRDITHKNF